MLWQNYKLFLNKRYITPGKTQFDIPAKAYGLVIARHTIPLPNIPVCVYISVVKHCVG